MASHRRGVGGLLVARASAVQAQATTIDFESLACTFGEGARSVFAVPCAGNRVLVLLDRLCGDLGHRLVASETSRLGPGGPAPGATKGTLRLIS